MRAPGKRRTGRPRKNFARTPRNAECTRRGGAKCAFPFDARMGFTDRMTKTLGWLVQRLGVITGSFGEGKEVLGEFTPVHMSKSKFRDKVLSAGRRAEAAQREKGRRIDLTPVYTPAQIASSVPCPPTMYLMMDGTGAPCVRKDLRRAKDGEGQAKTREIKVGVIGLYSRYNPKTHRPVRASASEIHVATADDAVDFGLMLRNVANAAGYGRIGDLRVESGGDGAPWIANVVGNGFHANVDGKHPGDDEIFMNDFYHAGEHLHAFILECEQDAAAVDKAFREMKDLLWKKGAEKTCRELARRYGDPKRGTEAHRQFNYLWERRRFMRYDVFREMMLFIGTGIMEAACRTDVARRCKQSGMHWRVSNASAMCALVARIRTLRKPA